MRDSPELNDVNDNWLHGMRDDISKGGVGSGIKGHRTARELPNKDLMDGLVNFRKNKYSNEGISNVNAAEGTFTITVENDNRTLVSHNVKVEGRRFILEKEGISLSVPEKQVEETVESMKEEGRADIFSDLVYNSGIKKEYNLLMNNYNSIKDNIKFYDTYEPILENIEGKGKYSTRMLLKRVKDMPDIIPSLVSYSWYSGNADSVSIIGEAVQEIVSGNLNETDLYQAPLYLLMKASRKTNRNHHTDFIYRGETNMKSAKALVESIVLNGEALLDNKLFSTSESEPLGKWYAGVRNQKTARGTDSKTNVMLKIPYDKYKNNVALDYKATGDNTHHPENEITIFGNGIKLTGDDVVIRAKLPTKKSTSWMSLSKFIKDGGDIQTFLDEMWEVKS